MPLFMPATLRVLVNSHQNRIKNVGSFYFIQINDLEFYVMKLVVN